MDHNSPRHCCRNPTAGPTQAGKVSELTILQLNTQRGLTTFDDMRRHLSEREYDVLLLQEPYCYEGRPLTAIGYFSVVGGENPSAVAYVKSNHGATLLSELSDQNMVVLELRGGGYPPLYLVTAYFRGVQQDDVNPDLQKLERVCTALRGKSFLISVDANAKSLVWHSRVECRRGGKIADFIATHRLEVCNRPGRLTTFCDTRGQGDNIDITLASPKLAENIKKLDYSRMVNK